MNRAVMLRIAASACIGLGAALLAASLLLWTYTTSKITKVPLAIDTTLLSDGTGAVLDGASLSGEHIIVNQNLPMVAQQQTTVEAPANADVVTLQVGTSVRRTDKQKDTGLLLAIVDTVTLNRKSAMAVSDDTHPGGAVQKPRGMNDTNPATNIALPHDGLSYRFPFHTQKKTYRYFDPTAQKPYDANYSGQEDVNGLTTYRFTQNIGYDAKGRLVAPVPYPSLYPNEDDTKITVAASTLDVPGEPDERITMNRYYAAQRTFWVDPVSGTIVKQTEHANHYFARDALKPEVALVDYRVASTEQTVEAQVNSARDERDRLALWSRVLPITFSAAGLITLIGGFALASFSLRTEAALIAHGLDGDAGVLGDSYRGGAEGLEEPVPGAEAETEKLPTRRPQPNQDVATTKLPTVSPGLALPESDPPELDPPASGPPN